MSNYNFLDDHEDEEPHMPFFRNGLSPPGRREEPVIPLIGDDGRVPRINLTSLSREMTILNRSEPGDFKHLDDYEVGHVLPGNSGVMKVIDRKDGEEYAFKKMKLVRNKHSPVSSALELKTLLKLKHPNIVDFEGIVAGYNFSEAYIAMEFCGETLHQLLESFVTPFDQPQLKSLMMLLMSGVKYMHDHHIMHRDLSPSNILISSYGQIKIGDFGKAVTYYPEKERPCNVGTTGYRAPELIVCYKKYTSAVDMWSVGCIFGQLLLHRPVFPGEGINIAQLCDIVTLCGASDYGLVPYYLLNSPHFDIVKRARSTFQTVFRDVPEHAVDLLRKFFDYDFGQRITASAVLQERYFTTEPLASDPSQLLMYFNIKKNPLAVENEPPGHVQNERLQHVNEARGNSHVDEARGNRRVDKARRNRRVDEARGNRRVDEARGNRRVDEARGNRRVDEARGNRRIGEARGNRRVDKAGGNRRMDEVRGNRHVDETGRNSPLEDGEIREHIKTEVSDEPEIIIEDEVITEMEIDCKSESIP